MSLQIELEEEKIPTFITESYLKATFESIDEFVKELRGEGNFDTSNQIIRLMKICEIVYFQYSKEEGKFKELSEKYVDATGRIEEAMKISQRDSDLIQQLKSEVEGAWKLADASKLREQHTNESLCELREKLFDASENLKKLTSRKLEDSDELGKHKTTILQECERLLLENSELNKRLLVQRAYSDEIQKKFDDSIARYRELWREWDQSTNQSLSNKKKVEFLTKQIQEMREDFEMANDTLIHFKEQSENRLRKLNERERQIASLVENLEKTKNENAVLHKAKCNLELSLKTYKSDVEHLKHETEQFNSYMRMKDDENRKLLIENERETKKIENLVRKISSVERIVSKQEQDIIFKRTEINTVEKERDLIKKSGDEIKKDNDKLLKKIENQMRDIEKFNATITELKHEKHLLEEDKSHIIRDLNNSIEREKKLNSNVRRLQSNLETVESEKLFMTGRIKQLREDVDSQKKHFETIKEELLDINKQVAHYKLQYNMTLKHLKDARADYQKSHEKALELKNRLMHSQSQIDDGNQKLANKIAECVELLKRIKQSEKKNRKVKRELERCQDSLKICRNEVKNLNHENEILKCELRDNDERFTKMKTQMDKTLRERDIIANQMYRKTDENCLLEEQASSLKIAIDRGNIMYNERLEDIRIMKLEISDLRSQSNALKRALENTVDMRHEVLQLHRKLNQERMKAKALEQEMLTPMNVHRWRKLNRRDPGRMELIKKCQRLQRNALAQFSKAAKGEEVIKALEEKIIALTRELEKRQNFDVHEKLLLTRTKLQNNTKLMKAAIALSRANDCDLRVKDDEIKKLQAEAADLKGSLINEKRGKSKLLEKLRSIKNMKASKSESNVRSEIESFTAGYSNYLK